MMDLNVSVCVACVSSPSNIYDIFLESELLCHETDETFRRICPSNELLLLYAFFSLSLSLSNQNVLATYPDTA